MWQKKKKKNYSVYKEGSINYQTYQKSLVKFQIGDFFLNDAT